MKRLLPASALTLLFWAGPVDAQERRLPDGGSWSIEAALPDARGTSFGLWRMMGSRLNVGIEIDYRNKESTDEGTSAFISPNTLTREDVVIWGPVARYYLATLGPVVPYARASLGLMKRDLEIEQINSGQVVQNQQESSYIWRLALGADWFPTKNVSFGFFTGLTGVVTDADIEVGTSGTIMRRIDNLYTFRSNVLLQLYF